MKNKAIVKNKYINYRIIYLCLALMTGILELTFLIKSLTFTSDNLFRLELETTFLVLIMVVYFTVLLIFELLIKIIGKRYEVVSIIFSISFILIQYCTFKKKWIDIFTISDYAIIPKLLLKSLIALVIIQLIWSFFISTNLFKEYRKSGLS